MRDNSNTLDIILNAVEVTTEKSARKSGNGYRVPCPAHGGKNPNLWIADGDNRIIMSCKSNHCDHKDIMESIGLSIKDVFYEPLNPEQAKEYKAKVTARQLMEELEHELIIVTLWMTDYSEGLFHRNGEDGRERTRLAFSRVQNALKYLEAQL